MKNITLISNWKLRDPYVAMFKGRLWKAIPDARIIDITHAIDESIIEQTSFILKTSYQSFPEGTLHIILTGNTLSHTSMPVMVEYNHHYFMGEDNGVFSLMFGDEPALNAVELNLPDEQTTVLDKCILMAQLHFEGQLKEKTVAYTNFVRKIQFSPEHDTLNRVITGQITYIDTRCNAITNIPVAMFKEAVKNGNFSVSLSSTRHITINRYHNFYNPKEEEIYIMGNPLGYLELTLNSGYIAVLADLKIGDKIEIRY